MEKIYLEEKKIKRRKNRETEAPFFQCYASIGQIRKKIPLPSPVSIMLCRDTLRSSIWCYPGINIFWLSGIRGIPRREGIRYQNIQAVTQRDEYTIQVTPLLVADEFIIRLPKSESHSASILLQILRGAVKNGELDYISPQDMAVLNQANRTQEKRAFFICFVAQIMAVFLGVYFSTFYGIIFAAFAAIYAERRKVLMRIFSILVLILEFVILCKAL